MEFTFATQHNKLKKSKYYSPHNTYRFSKVSLPSPIVGDDLKQMKERIKTALRPTPTFTDELSALTIRLETTLVADNVSVSYNVFNFFVNLCYKLILKQN